MKYVLVIFFLAYSNIALAKPMDFVLKGNGGNCIGCEWVAAEGEITSDTPKLLKDFIRKNDHRHNFYFDSSGGSLLAGMEIGEILRKYRADTSIGKTVKVPDGEYSYNKTIAGKCVSACAYAYLGGENRYSTKGLGFHQFYDKRILEGIDKAFTAKDRVLDQYLTGVIVNYLIRMGIDVSLYSFISSTPPKEIYFLSEIEMKKFGIDVDSNDTTPWVLKPLWGGLVGEFSTLEAKPRSAQFFCTKETQIHHRLNVVIPSDYYGDGTYDNVVDVLSRYSNSLYANEGLYINDSKIIGYSHFLDKPNNRFFISFSFSKDVAIKIIKSSKFVLGDFLGQVARVNQPIFDMLSFYSIKGDKSYPYSSMKSCAIPR